MSAVHKACYAHLLTNKQCVYTSFAFSRNAIQKNVKAQFCFNMSVHIRLLLLLRSFETIFQTY